MLLWTTDFWRGSFQYPQGMCRTAAASSSKLKGLSAEGQGPTAYAIGQMPHAMGFQRNTQKPIENLDFSWSGGARARASETFFCDFSLLGALWATSGRILATLERHVSALGCSLAQGYFTRARPSGCSWRLSSRSLRCSAPCQILCRPQRPRPAPCCFLALGHWQAPSF